MKRIPFIACFFLASGLLFSEYVGKAYVTYDPISGQRIKVLSMSGISPRGYFSEEMANGNLLSRRDDRDLLSDRFSAEIAKGNLVLRRSDTDSLIEKMEHRRFSQFHMGIPVFGGEIIQHFRDGKLAGVTGHYYEVGQVDLVPLLSPDEAAKKLEEALELDHPTGTAEEISQVIFPAADQTCRLCFQVKVKKNEGEYEIGLVDARSGEILARDTNLQFDGGEIGLGTDFHGVTQKFPTYLEGGTYYLYDDKAIRPYIQAIYDYRTGGYVPSDADNYWDQDGISVSAHYNVGLVYDFYYLYLGRSGMNGNNMKTNIFTHSSLGGYSDNASWNGVNLNFYVSGNQRAQYAAALDVVGHEFSHGVTDYASDLIYEFQPGALNESFSDIIGHAVEFSWQLTGTGIYYAEWLNGEDAFPSYDYGISRGYVRSAEDPNRYSQTRWSLGPDPCHLSQYYNLPFSYDRGGVHVNCTIYPHAFCLLAAGGTNRISGLSVSGIGLDSATKIYYRAWVYYLTKRSQFIDAANAILQSAHDLYGGSSNEYAQTIRSMQAIGWIVE